MVPPLDLMISRQDSPRHAQSDVRIGWRDVRWHTLFVDEVLVDLRSQGVKSVEWLVHPGNTDL
jgi:hypothetical protein